MTTKTETTKEKQIPAFYIFDTVESGGKKENKRVGAAFAHKKGNGYSFLISGKELAQTATLVRLEQDLLSVLQV